MTDLVDTEDATMSVIDQPFFVPVDDDQLFAVSSQPDKPRQTGVLLLPAGGYIFTPQQNRWAFDFAHRMAANGYPTVRFDWAGVGDSTGAAEDFTLDRPATADATAALSLLTTTSCVLVGQCFGARTAMAMANQVKGLAGVALLSPPVRDFTRGDGTATRRAYEMSTTSYVTEGLKRLRPADLANRKQLLRLGRLGRALVTAKWRKATKRFRRPDPTPWASRPFLEHLAWLVDNEVPTLLAYGEESNDLKEFNEAKAGRLGELLARGSATVQIAVIPGSLHNKLVPLNTDDTTETQNLMSTTIENWVVGL